MRLQLRTFLSNNARYKDKNDPSFGINYNSVAQKLRTLAIKEIFDPKNPFLTNLITAEITSFNLRYYIYIIKLQLCLRVATIKNASCARLWVRSDFGLRSCGCRNSKQDASNALDHNIETKFIA